MRTNRFLSWCIACCVVLAAISSTATWAAESASEKESAYKPVSTVDVEIPLDQLAVLVKPLTKEELQAEADAWYELLRQKAKQIAAAQLGIKKTNAVLDSKNGAETKAAIEEAAAMEEKAAKTAAAAEKELTQKAREELGVEEIESQADEAKREAEAKRAAATAAVEAPPSGGDDTNGVASAKKQELLAKVNELQDERTILADRLKVVLDSLEEKGGDVKEYRQYMSAVSGIQLDAKDASATWAAITGWVTSQEGGQRWAWNFGKFILILVISYLAAKIIAGVTNWLLERKMRLSQLAENLISRSIKNVVMLIGFAIALTALEIDITPILAAIGAAGFIIGFALQGTLSNFASGLMILINRPFDVGDIVTAGGITGKIHQMNLVSTTFRTFDNQTIHVPNNEIWGNVITNITANRDRRVDLEFGIGYDDDFEEAERIIREVVEEHELVLDDPEPQIVMHELADSSVNIVCRPWARTSDWWQVKTDVTRRVKKRFDEAGITIPYPQTDIHVYRHANEKSRVETGAV